MYVQQVRRQWSCGSRDKANYALDVNSALAREGGARCSVLILLQKTLLVFLNFAAKLVNTNVVSGCSEIDTVQGLSVFMNMLTIYLTAIKRS